MTSKFDLNREIYSQLSVGREENIGRFGEDRKYLAYHPACDGRGCEKCSGPIWLTRHEVLALFGSNFNPLWRSPQ